MVPGDVRQPFGYSQDARQVLNDAEAELHQWQPNLEPIESKAGNLGVNLMPSEIEGTEADSEFDGVETQTPANRAAATEHEHESKHLAEAT